MADLTDFQSIFAAAAPAFRVFERPVLITPMRDSRYVAGADPDRQPFTVAGILDTSFRVDRIAGRGGANPTQMDRNDEYAKVDFEISVFSSPEQWPRTGDKLTFTTLPGVPSYSIVRPSPSGQGRIEFIVARLAS